jgi:glycosyltransferase involved in cell wall biosynthesis
MRDLAEQFSALGHKPVVIVPSLTGDMSWKVETTNGVDILWLRAPSIRAATHVRRAIAEMRLPFSMLHNLRKSPLGLVKWDLVVWLAPPNSLGVLAWALRGSPRCLKYLIIRDIFPEWAVDLGVLRKGPAYLLLKLIATLQYTIADIIGVQTESNSRFVPKWRQSSRGHVEVLRNWLTPTSEVGCRISIANTSLSGRKIFVYVGNMGLSQSMQIFVDLAESLQSREDIGFLFVGRGSDFSRLTKDSAQRGLNNVLFFDEIDSTEIPGLLTQCHVGLVALHPAHKTDNIPGKFVSYVRYGVPVLACINAGSDLGRLIEEHGVGIVYVADSVDELKPLAEKLADDSVVHQSMSERARQLGESMFSTEAAAKQILAGLD